MSFNKWKSTNVYGIFNNKDLTDASLNVITPCEATFDGPLTAENIYVNSLIDANELNAVVGISCDGYITGNTLQASTTIQGGSLHILGSADIDSDLTCVEINADILKMDTPTSTINSSFSGQIIVSQPFRGVSYKKVVIWCNNSIGASSYTFPTAFTYLPRNTTNNDTLVTALSTTALTITTAVSTSQVIILEGF